MQAIDRHALLADPTRRRLLDALRDSGGAVDVRTLAQRVGVHRNSAREQLRRLEDARLVRSYRAAPSGRGRPGLRFELEPDGHADPYRLLAGVLADELTSLPGADALPAAAGERWGRAAVASHVPAGTRNSRGPAADSLAQEPVEVLVELLGRAGFAPEQPIAGDPDIRLHACPFLPLERHQLPVVCGVHLGFIRGALRELGSPLDAIAIKPFVRPDLCVATLGSPSDG